MSMLARRVVDGGLGLEVSGFNQWLLQCVPKKLRGF